MKAHGAQAVTAAEQAARGIVASYRSRTPASARCFERASRALAGGTTGNLRYFEPYPLYFASGQGSSTTDVDGNTYLDCFLCNGPLLLGHRHPAVLAAMREHEGIGSLVVNPPLALAVAELMQQLVPCAERVRFLNSGTEAVLSAVRIARAFTGRSKVVKFFGHYNGQDDQFLVGLGPSRVALGAGIPADASCNTVLLDYGNSEALAALLERDRDIAAVLLDPAMHSGGLWGSSTEYLREVRALTRKHGVVLIFDEVITGFRLDLGGAQSLHGVTPDMATFGKALAAGERLAAVAGREDIMRMVGPDTAKRGAQVFQSGTGNDGTLALAAAYGALTTYRQLESQQGYAALNALAATLAHGIRGAFRSHGIPCHVNQLGPMLQLFLSDETPGFECFSSIDTGPLALFYLALINAGVLMTLPTSNHIYLSFAHTRDDIETILSQVNTVLGTQDIGALVSGASAN